MNDDELKIQQTRTVRRHSEEILRLTASPDEHTTSNAAVAQSINRSKTTDKKKKKKKKDATKKKEGKVRTSSSWEGSADDEQRSQDAPPLVEQTTLHLAPSTSRILIPTDQLMSMTSDENSRNRSSRQLKENAKTSGGLPALKPGAVAVEDDDEEEDDEEEGDELNDSPIVPLTNVVSRNKSTDERNAAIPPEMARATSSGSASVASRRTAVERDTERGNQTVGAQSVTGIDATNGDFDDQDAKQDPTSSRFDESVATATAITRDDLEEEVRRQIMAEAIVAEVIPVNVDKGSETAYSVDAKDKEIVESSRSKRPRSTLLLCVGLSCVLMIGLIIGLLVGLLNKNDSDPNLGALPGNTLPPGSSPGALSTLLAFLQIQSPLVGTSGTPQNRALMWMVENSVTMNDPLVWTKYALATFYYSTGGQSWTRNDNWLDLNVSLCDWYPGGLCSVSGGSSLNEAGAGGHKANAGRHTRRRNLRRLQRPGDSGNTVEIESLSLAGNNLIGTLPAEIGLLTDLEILVLDDNPALGGTLPDELGSLSSLESFLASHVGFVGMLPSTLGNLESIEEFNLFETSGMTGPLPTDLWTQPRLKKLNLQGVGLTGKLPRGGRAPKEAYLRYNFLTGTIPVSSGNDWGGIAILDLRDNSLTGTIPPFLHNNFENDLRIVRLEGNKFRGTMPSLVCEQFLASAADVSGTTYEMSADCGEDDFVCSCCTLCCVYGEQCEEQ